MTQSQNITVGRIMWRTFFLIIPPQPLLGLRTSAGGRLKIAALLADAGSPALARIHRISTHTAKHPDQMRSAAVVHVDSNNKPQARLRVCEERK
jgi:hypothetical protein